MKELLNIGYSRLTHVDTFEVCSYMRGKNWMKSEVIRNFFQIYSLSSPILTADIIDNCLQRLFWAFFVGKPEFGRKIKMSKKQKWW